MPMSFLLKSLQLCQIPSQRALMHAVHAQKHDPQECGLELRHIAPVHQFGLTEQFRAIRQYHPAHRIEIPLHRLERQMPIDPQAGTGRR